MSLMDATEFIKMTRQNPCTNYILDRLKLLALPQIHLTAGCLFQTIWNVLEGRIPTEGIKDYDIFYYDDQDLSWEAENTNILAAKEMFGEIPVEVKNQARVHLWYAEKWGGDYSPLQSCTDGMDRFLIACTAVGVNEKGDVYCPNGLGDLTSGVLRINPLNPRPDLFLAKAMDYKSRWDWLTIQVPDNTSAVSK